MGAAFAGTAWTYGALFPNDAVQWWVNKIEFMLAIITPTALAVIFLNGLGRIVLDAVAAIWKGFSNGNVQSIMA